MSQLGVEEDFADFVAAEGQRLLRYARLQTDTVEDAEDLVQIALARAYLAWPRVARADNRLAYVLRIITNSRISLWRGRRQRDGAASDNATTPDHAGSVTDNVALFAAMNRLPTSQRQVVVLRYYMGFSEADTATVLGWKVGTVKSQASRGLARLRRALSVDEVDGPMTGASVIREVR